MFWHFLTTYLPYVNSLCTKISLLLTTYLPLIVTEMFLFLFKFTFIFIYNSYGLIVEEFFVRFCSRAIILWWLLFGCTFMILPGKKGINYYMCTGENPSNDFYSTKKVRVVCN